VINICTPSGLHARMGIEAAQAGKHVVVEKPMALTIQDADALIAACAQANVTLTVVLQNRYNPPMQDLKALVESGRLGRLLLGNATVRWYRPQSYYEDGWHGTRAMDGGALMNQSIHHIDALQWLMGDVDSVFAYGATLAHCMECEDIGVAVWKFRSGALGVIEGSTVTWPENLEGSVAIFGERRQLTALPRRLLASTLIASPRLSFNHRLTASSTCRSSTPAITFHSVPYCGGLSAHSSSSRSRICSQCCSTYPSQCALTVHRSQCEHREHACQRIYPSLPTMRVAYVS
jgi:hypothetical protein